MLLTDDLRDESIIAWVQCQTAPLLEVRWSRVVVRPASDDQVERRIRVRRVSRKRDVLDRELVECRDACAVIECMHPEEVLGAAAEGLADDPGRLRVSEAILEVLEVGNR